MEPRGRAAPAAVTHLAGDLFDLVLAGHGLLVRQPGLASVLAAPNALAVGGEAVALVGRYVLAPVQQRMGGQQRAQRSDHFVLARVALGRRGRGWRRAGGLEGVHRGFSVR